MVILSCVYMNVYVCIKKCLRNLISHHFWCSELNVQVLCLLCQKKASNWSMEECNPSLNIIPGSTFITKYSASNWIIYFHHRSTFLGLSSKTELFTQAKNSWFYGMAGGEKKKKERFCFWLSSTQPPSPKSVSCSQHLELCSVWSAHATAGQPMQCFIGAAQIPVPTNGGYGVQHGFSPGITEL